MRSRARRYSRALSASGGGSAGSGTSSVRISPTEALRDTITKVVGDRPLKEARTRLVIPSLDMNARKVYLFKTPHPEQIWMLSLSTTSYRYRIGNPDRPRGFAIRAPWIIDTFMFGQAQCSVNAAC